MIDGSHLSFEENIALTKEVVDLAHPRKVAVEAELGRLAGFEEVAEAKLDFRRLTEIREKVDVPLVLHGASGVPAWIIEKAVKFGAQLAGAKGIPDESIKRAINLGVAKINIDTDLRLAFTGAVREVLATTPSQFDPRKILGSAREAMKEVVKGKMRLFESSGKA